MRLRDGKASRTAGSRVWSDSTASPGSTARPANGVRILALGGIPGKVYERPEPFKLGAPDPTSALRSIGSMATDGVAHPQVVGASGEALWFLGTLARIKLDGHQTGGRFRRV